MKKLFTLFAMLTLTVSVMAQTISYQAVLRDTTDGKNELVRNDTGNVVFSVMAYQDGVQTSQKLAPKPFKTNADGMLSLPVDFSAVNGNIDWRNNQITAVFAYGEGYKDTIVLVTPVSAVPYAAQAKDGDLTTGVITTYINSTANDEVPDFNLVWNALMANGNLTKAMRDSIADYLKDNYKYAKEILYSYMSQVTADDMREAYAQVRNLPQETKDAIDTVLKRYLQKHRDLVIEVAEYYALTATEEEVRTVYNDLKSNGPAAAKIRELLYDYFGRYMAYKGLVCPGNNNSFCDVVEAMSQSGTTVQTDCGTVQDHEGNVYNTVIIGNQCWTKENMRCTTSPSTGTYIVNNTTNDKRSYTGKIATWYNNDSVTAVTKGYGLLYNWNAAMDTFNIAYGEKSINVDNQGKFSVTFTGNRRGICPQGWHLPTDAEWNAMEATVCGSDWQTSWETAFAWRGEYAGKLVTGDWKTDDITQNTTDPKPGNLTYSERNSSHLSLLPVGQYRAVSANFETLNVVTFLWTSTQDDSNPAQNIINRSLNTNQSGVSRYRNEKRNCFSVRCVRD